MSIYITGIQVPTSPQRSRTINIYADGTVTDITGKLVGEAISVPNHGRLVDAEALAELFRSKAAGEKGLGSLMVNMAALCIDNAPVVISADKE